MSKPNAKRTLRKYGRPSHQRPGEAKAGKRHGNPTQPPASVRTPKELAARRRRQERPNGAFGKAPAHVWNFLVTGTSGEEREAKKGEAPTYVQVPGKLDGAAA